MTNPITKSGGQKHSLDKFYTKPEVARELISRLDLEAYDLIIEPSAGNGSFSKQIPGCVAYDLEPEDESIIKKDWFTVEHSRDRKILVVGNPPFGQQNNISVAFINHAAKFASAIAFVLPKSFMKDSIQAKLNKHLHLIENVVLEGTSFTLQDEDYQVPCVFQVWEYKDYPRPAPLKYKTVGFSFVRKDEQPVLYVQRIGGRSGTGGLEWQDRSVSSNYFLKMEEANRAGELLSDLGKADFSVRHYSVGPRSISKNELLKALFDAGSNFVEIAEPQK